MKTKILILSTIIFFAVSPVFASTYYVRSDGNDSLDGMSDSTAWKTLYKASVSISSGDTVLLRRGDIWNVTHNRRDSLAQGIGLTILDNDILVGAYGTGAKPIIDATAKTEPTDVHNLDSGYAPIMLDDDYGSLTLKDLDLRGPALGPALDIEGTGGNLSITNCEFQGAGWEAEGLIEINGGNNTIIQDCIFDQITGNSNGYSKSFEQNGGSGHIIRRNIFYGFASGGAVRFSDGGTGGIIEQNYFYHPDIRDDWAWAIVIRSADGGTYVVRNNVIDLTNHGQLTSSSELRGMAFWDDHAPTTRKIINNTIISSDKAGVGIQSGGATNFGYNNIFYDLSPGWNNIKDGTDLRNNVFYSCGSKYLDGTPNESGSLTDDPNLSNPSMSNNSPTDARINFPSVAIDAGFSGDSDIPSDDFEGKTRPTGNEIDIGAFEYGLGAPQNLRIISAN
jgi:hypothetical protein